MEDSALVASNSVVHTANSGTGHPLEVACSRSRALRIPEILNEIFSPLSLALEDSRTSTSDIQNARTTLLHAALSCRNFSEPALSALWRVLTSLVPLFRLLPTFTTIADTFILGSVNEEDRVRFDRRARFVRVLILGAQCDPIAPSTYFRIWQLRTTPALPALRKITILDGFNAFDSLAPFFSLSSSVRSVELSKNAVSKQQFVRPFLSEASRQAHAITYLQIQGHVCEADLCLILSFASLRVLDVEFLDERFPSSFMVELGKLCDLRSLTIRVGNSVSALSALPPDTAPPHDRFFKFFPLIPVNYPRLRKLRLFGHSDATLVVLAFTASTALEFIEIDESFGESITKLPVFRRKNAMMVHLVSKAQRLQSFIMVQQMLGNIVEISSFLQAQRLKILDFTRGHAVVGDGSLHSLAKHLIHLEVLILPSFCHVENPTLKFIWTPGMLPPMLQVLKISTHNLENPVTVCPALPDIHIRRDDAHHHLRKLFICSYFTTTDSEVNQLSKLIHYAFPKLDAVDFYGSPLVPEPMPPVWERVNGFRAVIREACEYLEQDIRDGPL